MLTLISMVIFGTAFAVIAYVAAETLVPAIPKIVQLLLDADNDVGTFDRPHTSTARAYIIRPTALSAIPARATA